MVKEKKNKAEKSTKPSSTTKSAKCDKEPSKRKLDNEPEAKIGSWQAVKTEK